MFPGEAQIGYTVSKLAACNCPVKPNKEAISEALTYVCSKLLVWVSVQALSPFLNATGGHHLAQLWVVGNVTWMLGDPLLQGQ